MQLYFCTAPQKAHKLRFECFDSVSVISRLFSSSLCLYLCFPELFLFFSLLPYLLSLTTDIQKKQPGEDCTSKPIQSTGSSQSSVFSSETSSSSSQSVLSSPPSSSEQPSTEEPSPTFPSTREGKKKQPSNLSHFFMVSTFRERKATNVVIC